jgi:hypothetical protein
MFSYIKGIFTIVCLTLFALSQVSFGQSLTVSAINPNLKYFGYYSTDADQVSTNLTKIKNLQNSNVAVVNYNPTTVSSMLTNATSNNLKIALHVSPFLFDYSVKPTVLRSDYLTLISQMQTSIGTKINQVYAFYFDEPIWQGVSKNDFRNVSSALRNTFVNTGVMTVEAVAPLKIGIPYTSPYNISNVYVDSSYLEFVTDTGFDYFVYSCQSLDFIHQNLLNTLASVATLNQKLWLVPDSAINLSCTNSAQNLNGALTYYYNIANNNPRVIGLMNWSHSSYLNSQTIEQIGYVGTRQIFDASSQYYNFNLKKEHIDTGKLIV